MHCVNLSKIKLTTLYARNINISPALRKQSTKSSIHHKIIRYTLIRDRIKMHKKLDFITEANKVPREARKIKEKLYHEHTHIR